MAEKMAFITAIKDRTEIVFEIDGEEFHFTPGKTARITLAALKAGEDAEKMRAVGLAVIDWLSDGLPDVEAKRLETRLMSPEDEFGFDDLAKIANAMLTEVAGRPFGLPQGSSTLPANGGMSSTPTPPTEGSTPSTSPSTDSSAG